MTDGGILSVLSGAYQRFETACRLLMTANCMMVMAKVLKKPLDTGGFFIGRELIMVFVFTQYFSLTHLIYSIFMVT
jgi:hypothetical protein